MDQIRTYPGLLTSRRFWGYALAAGFASGCFFAYLGGAPYVGDKIFGLSSTEVGALFALTAIGYAAGNFFAGRFSVRVGMNRMILIGTLVTRAGCCCLRC
jgi:MFS transporter, DHA1 family, multidrug resistance protein